MKSIDCKDCKYIIWMVAIGQGVRCGHPSVKPTDGKLPPIISTITDCKFLTPRTSI